MVTDKITKYPRKVFLASNKYQKTIICLTFIPSILIFLSFIFIVIIGNPIMSKAVLHTSFSDMEKLANQFSGWMVLLMCLSLLLSVVMAFIISHNMVGSFERIIRELDEIIAGRSLKTIKSRSKDGLTNDLLKRVNVLVENYIKNKNEK